MTAKAEALTNDLSARISRAQLDIDTAALRQRIAELEAELERLRAERWEPVKPHGYERITDVMDVYEADGEMLLRWYTEGYYWDVALPANIRLCRQEARNDS